MNSSLETLGGFDPIVQAAIDVALEAGQKIKTGEFRKKGSDSAKEKDDPNVGHHAIVTKEDTKAQTFILKKLAPAFPDMVFITEEKQENDPTSGRILNDGNLSLFFEKRAYIVDPLDGSSFRNRTLSGWSVSIGDTDHGQHVGGVINAPTDGGSLLVAGDKNNSVIVLEENSERKAVITPREIKKSVVFIGLDIHFLRQFSRFLYAFSPKVQTVSSTTCALGLAYLCAGKIDALIQPVQCPWDWAAGYPLVTMAGGKFQFYHYRNGFPEPMEKPDLASYSPTQRNTAFIAGVPDLVDWLFDLLYRDWQA